MVSVSTHPLVAARMRTLRDAATPSPLFRQMVYDLSTLLCYEATQDLHLTERAVATPMGQAPGRVLSETIGLVPILRAGLGMVNGMLALLPEAQVWHIGLYRDEETLQPVSYYNKLPADPTVDMALVIDPMLATGGSAVATIDVIRKWGVGRIKFVCLIAAPEGVAAVTAAHPDVPIYTAVVDSHLNDIGFIVPGLGDAGDRQFGTA